MYPLANNLSSYTINLMDIGFWSCCCSPADLRAEAEEIVTLKRQLRMLPNLERNHTGLHLEHRSSLYTSLSSSIKANERLFSLSDSVRHGTVSNPQPKPMIER